MNSPLLRASRFGAASRRRTSLATISPIGVLSILSVGPIADSASPLEKLPISPMRGTAPEFAIEDPKKLSLDQSG
jgi:hypothetical protein